MIAIAEHANAASQRSWQCYDEVEADRNLQGGFE